MTNINPNGNVIRVKILHDTTYQQIQQETNNYMKNISLLGGKVIGNPQLSLKRLPKDTVNKLQRDIDQRIQEQQKDLQELSKEVYQKCLRLYSQQHPNLQLKSNTTIKALQFYGLSNVIKGIKQAQQKVIVQYKKNNKIIPSNTKISDLQYYMKITYEMSYRIYQDSKQYSWL